jgi:hypothetical protein
MTGGISDRIGRTLAFGQFLARELETDQFGMYGTAAAIEAMATSDDAKRFLEAATSKSVNPEWLKCFLGTWNYFDLIVRGHFRPNVSLDQSRSTLRICHMLRAATVARPVLRMASAVMPSYVDQNLARDIRLNLGNDPAQDIARMLFDRLLSTRTVDRITSVGSIRWGTLDTYTFKYGTDSYPTQIPKNTRDWLFMWGTVLVALERAFRSGALEEKDIATIVQLSDLQHMKEAIDDDETCDDPRFKAFALWALDHLREDLPGFPEIPDSSHLRLWADGNQNWLHEQIGRTCKTLLMSGDWLDRAVPYERSVTGSSESFLDHFLVPVVPLILDLLARHQPRKLFIPRIRRLLALLVTRCNERLADGDVPALQYQNSRWNGTVNSLYYREAAQSVSAIFGKRRGFIVWWLNCFWGWFTGQSKMALLASFAILLWLASFYFLYTKSDDKLVYFFLGIGTSFVTNLASTWFFELLRKNANVDE